MNTTVTIIRNLEIENSKFINLAAKAYCLLCELYEREETVGVKKLLVSIGAIAPEDWVKYPSGYRKLATRIIQTTMVFQAAIGDERDLQSVIEQNKVSEIDRRCQRSALRRAIDEVFDRKPKRRKAAAVGVDKQLPQQYINGLPM